MSVRIENGGKTYEIDVGLATQTVIENQMDKPFGAVLQRFIKGFTADTFAILLNCVKVIEDGISRPLQQNEVAPLTQDTEGALALANGFLEAQKQWSKSIGAKAELETLSSDGALQDTAPIPSTKLKTGKSKQP
jgi:hypothetical protein